MPSHCHCVSQGFRFLAAVAQVVEHRGAAHIAAMGPFWVSKATGDCLRIRTHHRLLRTQLQPNRRQGRHCLGGHRQGTAQPPARSAHVALRLHLGTDACGFKLALDGHDTRAIQAYRMSTVRYTALLRRLSKTALNTLAESATRLCEAHRALASVLRI
jgi:hypothetical protein